MDKFALRSARFKLLMEQYREWFESTRKKSRGWQADFAREIGKTPAAVSQYWGGETRPEPDTLDATAKALNIPVEFFTDPSLGESPNYRDFVGKRFASASIRATTSASATATTRYEPEPRDEEGLSVWDRFLFSDASERASAEAIAYYKNHLDEVSGRDGLTVELIAAAVRAFDAGRRSRAVEEPEVHSEIRPGRFARQPVKKTK